MNLSNIKKVAFIENFNPKKGYPEFGNHTVAVKAPVIIIETKEPAVLPKWKKIRIKRLKKAKKDFNKTVGIGYKPTLLVSSKLD